MYAALKEKAHFLAQHVKPKSPSKSPGVPVLLCAKTFSSGSHAQGTQGRLLGSLSCRQQLPGEAKHGFMMASAQNGISTNVLHDTHA